MARPTRDELTRGLNEVKAELQAAIDACDPTSHISVTLRDVLARLEEWERHLQATQSNGRDTVQVAVETAGWVRIVIEIINHML